LTLYQLTDIIKPWKGGNNVENEKIKALQELLKILSENPDVAERITITIRPDKLKQSEAEK
jgi:hypothetical protein